MSHLRDLLNYLKLSLTVISVSYCLIRLGVHNCVFMLRGINLEIIYRITRHTYVCEAIHVCMCVTDDCLCVSSYMSE